MRRNIKDLKFKFRLRQVDNYRRWSNSFGAYGCVTESILRACEESIIVMYSTAGLLPDNIYTTFDNRVMVYFSDITVSVSATVVKISRENLRQHIPRSLTHAIKTENLAELCQYLTDEFPCKKG